MFDAGMGGQKTSDPDSMTDANINRNVVKNMLTPQIM